MNEIVLRDAAPTDAPTVAEVVRQSFAEYEPWLTPPSGANAETSDTVLQKMAQGHVTLALLGGEMVGCVFTEPRDGFLYLGRLAVLPSHRHQGVGRALMDSAEARATRSGLPAVRLGVRIALPENRAYYERLGYCHCGHGTHPGCSEPTFLWMEKAL